jgi:hypothetical protein
MKRIAIPVAAGLAVSTATFAFAAGFGGLTAGAVGAADVTVAACDSDGIVVTYPAATWDATDRRLEFPTVTITGVSDSCDGRVLKVTPTDGAGTSLSEGTLTIPTSAATSHTVTFAAAVAAHFVEAIHVSIG